MLGGGVQGRGIKAKRQGLTPHGTVDRAACSLPEARASAALCGFSVSVDWYPRKARGRQRRMLYSWWRLKVCDSVGAVV